MAIVVNPALESAVESMAQLLARPAQQIADEAIRVHLDYLRTRQLEEEAQAFVRLYPELAERYRQHFVAIHNSKVIDSDKEFERLFLRVQARLGDLPVLIQQVTDGPVEEWHFRSPRVEMF